MLREEHILLLLCARHLACCAVVSAVVANAQLDVCDAPRDVFTPTGMSLDATWEWQGLLHALDSSLILRFRTEVHVSEIGGEAR